MWQGGGSSQLKGVKAREEDGSKPTATSLMPPAKELALDWPVSDSQQLLRRTVKG